MKQMRNYYSSDNRRNDEGMVEKGYVDPEQYQNNEDDKKEDEDK